MAKVGWQVGCATLLVVLIAYFGGAWLDRLLGTQHWMMIVFLIAAGPLAVFISYRLALRTMRAMTPEGQAEDTETVGEEQKIGQ